MNTDNLAKSVVEQNNPKFFYDKMLKCKEQAANFLSLAKSYGRDIQAGSHSYKWEVREQLWLLETPKFSNYIPTDVAAEDLAFQLYNDTGWHFSFI